MTLLKSSFRNKIPNRGLLCRQWPWKPGDGFHLLGILLLVGAVIAAMPALAQGGIFNVRAFGATGNGVADDAPAIQAAEVAAEKAGGGTVYLPAGKYLMNSSVLVGSNIELHGDGDTTVLIRSNTPSKVPDYGADCTTSTPPLGTFTPLLWNRHYNCEDQNIYLHDFKADGSAITTVPCGPFLGLSGLVNSTVANITLVNTPQDAMFFRNGGVNLTVKNNKILLHNTLWGNGAGINIEMHVNGQIWGPANITNNQIVTGATNFCTAALKQSCSRDSDCSGLQLATCGKGGSDITGIAITWADGTHPPVVTITNNQIWVGNNHYGIICNGCVDSTISGNVIRPMKLRHVPGVGTYTGISSYSTAGGAVQNLTIEGNTIEGTGESGDGPAINVSGLGVSENGLTIQDNVIAHKNTSSSNAVIQVSGLKNVAVSGNRLCFVPSNAIHLGSPGRPVVNGTQTKNTILHMGKQSGRPPKECSTLPQ
jgi:hypothetical protein